MNLTAILAIVALNVVLFLAGAGALWGIRGWSSWGELARLGGVAHLLGLGSVAWLLIVELVVGIPFGPAAILTTAAAIAIAGVVGGRLLGRTVPPVRAPRTASVGGSLLLPAVGLALIVVYLEAAFRAARLSGLFEWDAMTFWVPKGEAIYFFGGFDHQFFTTLPGPSYPPLVPVLDAANFAFMGRADAVTLHVAFWFALAGFIWAMVGLLADRVRPLVLWSLVLLLAVAPLVVDHGTLALADLILDYFLAVAAVLLALWLLERKRWQIVLAIVFLAAATATKREGLLFALCALLAAAAASWRYRRAWPVLALGFATVLASTVPWRFWLERHSVGGQGPEAGYLGWVSYLGRAWPSLRLTTRVMFDGSAWSLVPLLVVGGLLASILARRHILAAYAGCYLVLGILACSWVTVSFPDMPITANDALNPIVRLSGGVVVPLAALLPLLLDGAWHGLALETAT